MSLLRIVHCLVDAEPTNFHAKPHVYAVNLAFECVRDRSEDVDLDLLEKAAREAFGGFLAAAGSGASFLVFRRSDGILKYVGGTGPVLPASPSPTGNGSGGDIMAWLDHTWAAWRKLSDPGKSETFWTTADGGDAQTSIDAEQAGASARLRSVQVWDAPVGHLFGLTYLVRLESAPDAEDVLLPVFGGIAPPTDPIPVRAYPANGDLNDPTTMLECVRTLGTFADLCRTVRPKAQSATNTLDGRLTPEGYFKVNPAAEELRRFLNAFEQRAPGIMSSPRAIALHEGGLAGSSEYAKLFRIETTISGDKRVHRLLGPVAWAVAGGLLASLDMLILAIAKPSTGGRSEGEVLAPLVSAVLDRLDRTGPSWVSSLKSDLDIAVAIRRALGASSLFGTGFTSPAHLVAVLRKMHGIGDEAVAGASGETRLLGKILGRLAEVGLSYEMELSAEEVAWFGDAHPLEFVLRPVSEAEAKLHGEAGAEAAIVRLFELAAGAKDVPQLLTEQIGDQFEPPLQAADRATLRTAVAEAWVDYRAALDDRFNGAEAIRRSAASEFVASLFVGLGIGSPGPADMIGRLMAGRFHRDRLAPFDGEPGSFAAILNKLPRLPDLDGDLVATVRSHLDAAFALSIHELATLGGTGKRFVPDTAPQPLAIQIAADVSGDLIEPFLEDFNGIGVAIRRVEPGTEDGGDFAHANLAELHWPSPWRPENVPGPLRQPATIHPILPAVSDGRGPMFVEYQGFPFAPSGFGDLAVSGVETQDPMSRLPFHTPEIADHGPIGQPLLPTLAYGRWFQSYAFGVTNAGTLPLRLQQPGDPWIPAKAGRPYADAEGNDPVIAWSAERRRTAIGEMTLAETGSAPGGGKIGRAIEGVVALTSDYPRLHLHAIPGADATLDLFREADGVGTLTLGAYADAREVVFDVLNLSGESTVQIRIFSGPADDPEGGNRPSWTVPVAQSSRRLTIRFVRQEPDDGKDGDGSKTGATTASSITKVEIRYILDDLTDTLGVVEVEAGELCWLRLGLTVKPGGPSTCLSFAAPEAATGARPTSRLLILAPSQGLAWKADVPTQVSAEVTTPRVGYLDFLRWMTNVDLRTALGGSADAFMHGLAMAYAMRHVDPRLAAALDRLPDPAVDMVSFTLSAIDTIDGGNPFEPIDDEIVLTDRLSKAATKFGDVWKVRAPKPEDWPSFDGDELLSLLLDPLDELFRFRIRISSHAGPSPLSLADDTVTVRIPPGIVAELAGEARVLGSHFGDASDRSKPPGVIHPGILQFASRKARSGYVAFPSFALRVETMVDAVPDVHDEDAHGELISLAERMIGLVPRGEVRRYDLVAPASPSHSAGGSGPTGTATSQTGDEAIAADRAVWRLYSHVDVISQRWRPSGRPAYRSLEPRKIAWNGEADTAAFRLAWRVPEAGVKGSEVARASIVGYEREVFFDRPNVDADTVTQRLLPLPAVTVLQSFPWDAPSATYLRHRFVLRSRYAGALLRSDRREIDAFPALSLPNGQRREIAETWTLRAVILADFGRVQLTRPQLRALIPLTGAPGTAGTPPVLAILQEPPFSYGGLGDRVTAELKTGFGYGFARVETKGVPGPAVEILDSRKEFGPDPRLDYRPTPAADVLRLGIATEGPIGLTFDSLHAGAPAFPNSAFLLTPARPEGATPTYEEHFVGVSMSRHLDPAWTFVPRRSITDVARKTKTVGMRKLQADRSWWVSLPSAAGSATLLEWDACDTTPPVGGGTVLTVSVDQLITLRASKFAVDGVPGEKETVVDVATLVADRPIAILHRPVAPGRYLVSILALTAPGTFPSIDDGRSASPLPLASFEWGLPEGIAPVRISLGVPKEAVVEPVLASAPTFLAWTRTLRAFDRVTVANGDRAVATDRVDVAKLRASVETRDLPEGKTQVATILEDGRPRFLTSSVEADPFPVHVHRHLGFVLTRLLDGPGRRIEEFVHAGRFCGAEAYLPKGCAASADRLNMRLVEIETVAAVLCGTPSPAIPHTYRRHYFDLLSTGWVAGGATTLFVRPVGEKARLGKLETLILTLWTTDADGTEKSSRTEISIKPGEEVRTVEIDLVEGGAVARVVRLSGKREPAADIRISPENLGLTVPGFFVTIDAAPKGDAGEFWCDVSVLHGHRDGAGEFDFGWLFSGGGVDDVAGALTPDELGRATEEQAHVVSVSPPFETSGDG